MLTHLIALSLQAATPTPTTTLPPITDEEVTERAAACYGLITGRLEPAPVIEHFQLDTEQKMRDFVLGCREFALGVQLGAQSNQQADDEDDDQIHPPVNPQTSTAPQQ